MGELGEPWSTSDLGTAAYIHALGGLKILGVTLAPRGTGAKYLFAFQDPEGKGDELQVEYMNSDCRKFDAAVRSLKKLCYEDGNRARREANRQWASS